MTGRTARNVDPAREVWQAMADLVLDNERRREVSEAVGLSFGKIRALRRIARRPMPMGELAALLTVDPPNLTALVDDLERSGLVERQAHPTDRRAKLVVATPAGTAVARRAEKILERPPQGLSELTDEDLETLARILSRVRSDTRAQETALSEAQPSTKSGRMANVALGPATRPTSARPSRRRG